jgi:hypothetical protein
LARRWWRGAAAKRRSIGHHSAVRQDEIAVETAIPCGEPGAGSEKIWWRGRFVASRHVPTFRIEPLPRAG